MMRWLIWSVFFWAILLHLLYRITNNRHLPRCRHRHSSILGSATLPWFSRIFQLALQELFIQLLTRCNIDIDLWQIWNCWYILEEALIIHRRFPMFMGRRRRLRRWLNNNGIWKSLIDYLLSLLGLLVLLCRGSLSCLRTRRLFIWHTIAPKWSLNRRFDENIRCWVYIRKLLFWPSRKFEFVVVFFEVYLLVGGGLRFNLYF